MKKLIIALMIVVSAMSIVVTDAQARRLGGGGTFGKQSQSVSRPAPTQSTQSTNTAAPTAPSTAPQPLAPKPASPWKSMLGGAALGLGVGALMSHFGMGGAMGGMLGSILMIALLAFVVMFIFRMFRRKSNDDTHPVAYAGDYGSRSYNTTPEIGSRIEPVALAGTSASNVSALPSGVPADFDVPAFLRNAKTYFIRLQAAWDRADINDIREFTSPEMFGELRLQIQERGASPNNTDVVTLDAALLGVETLGNDYLASVKFSGMIKESDNAPAEPFTEVWNLSKPTSGQGGWILAGIQQLS